MDMNAFIEEALTPFLGTGEISEIGPIVKSGKEATVICCRAGEAVPEFELIAAKVYRPFDNRSFKQSSVYQSGRMQFQHNTRLRRAIQNNSDFGKQMAYTIWVHDEWTSLCHVYEAGVDTPVPIASNQHAVLMEYIGDAHGTAAPRLHEVDVDTEEARALTEELLEQIEIMLDAHRVHGDFSPYNILYHQGRTYVIDFPQAVDPRLHATAFDLLRRDVVNICNWATDRGVAGEFNGDSIALDLWERFRVGEIG